MKRIVACVALAILVSCAHDMALDETAADTYIRIRDVGSRTQPDTPILEMRGDTARNRRFIERMHGEYAALFPSESWSAYGFDASYREIEVCSAEGRLVLQSWHALFEKNPKLVATSHGVETLGNRTREEALAQDDQEYVKRRKAFDALYAECLRHGKEDGTARRRGD